MVDAISAIKRNGDSRSVFYDDSVPIEDVIKKGQEGTVISEGRVKRIDYELSVLQNLRNKLRVRDLWISNGYKYRDPDYDLPKDFDEKKEKYCSILGKDIKERMDVLNIKGHLKKWLSHFNNNISKDSLVDIVTKSKVSIKVSKLKERIPPPNLEKIKKEVFARWGSTDLSDVVKETDFLVNFIDCFIPSTSREVLDKDSIRRRLLLVILGYGTNTGLKSISDSEKVYNELRYTNSQYMDPEYLRESIRKIINSLLDIRLKHLWGDCTSSVGSDSRLFKASDQNLMSQWHPRYHKNGVVIYWHVDKGSTCIYSQLKSCSSSEVALMMEGVLRHCTEVSIEKNYVDSHGASEVGFAFAYMLGFKLMPRFKGINKQKLYYASKEEVPMYKEISSILLNGIKWDRIEKERDQMIKYAVAMKLGTSDAESIMRRFTRDNLQHPTYKALKELGRAVKTIFLCQYLSSESMRQEIHEGLNIVERWNSMNDFIFYGKSSTLQNISPVESEISMLCLHILQLSCVYINTLMLQEVISESDWLDKMTEEDKRAISPLLQEHINPYGQIQLDMSKRLKIKNPKTILRDVI